MATLAELAADMADAEELLSRATRPKVKTMLTEYLTQLRDEYISRSANRGTPTSKPAAKRPADGPLKPDEDPDMPPAERPPAVKKVETQLPTASASAPTSPPTTSAPAPTPAPAAPRPPPPPPPPPVKIGSAPTSDVTSSGLTYTTIPSFGWDQDGYGTEPNYVYVYITSGLDGVGNLPKENITCDFKTGSFDLKVHGFNGKNLRLLKDNLDKEIVPEESKLIVKPNKITIKMRKVKGTYGADHWTNLTGKHAREPGKKSEPGAELMDMMKDLYDNGDDNMKKALGEAMLKSRQTQATGRPDFPPD